jgi:hypothetical protein
LQTAVCLDYGQQGCECPHKAWTDTENQAEAGNKAEGKLRFIADKFD